MLSALLCATLCVYQYEDQCVVRSAMCYSVYISMRTNVLSALLCATLCVDQYEDQCVVCSAMCYSMCVSV